MVKWAVKLNELNIFYYSRSSIKVQVLANFFVKCIWSDDKLKEALAYLSTKQPDLEITWILHMDGTSNS